MRGALFALLCGLALPAWAGEILLQGTVRAEPRVHPKASSGGGGAYGSRELQYITRLDYDHLKHVVVYADPESGAEIAPEAETLAILKITRSRSGVWMTPDFNVLAPGSQLAVQNESSLEL